MTDDERLTFRVSGYEFQGWWWGCNREGWLTLRPDQVGTAEDGPHKGTEGGKSVLALRRVYFQAVCRLGRESFRQVGSVRSFALPIGKANERTSGGHTPLGRARLIQAVGDQVVAHVQPWS
jgi:hypothetical protein